MAIDEDEIEDDEDEDETPAKKGKKGKKPPAKAPPPTKRPPRGAAVAGSVDASMNGGHRDMPPKTKVSGARARTFKNWVSGLAHREMPPAHFVCELSDGNEKTIPLQENKSGSAYLINECIQTIESYDPVKVEAIFVDEDDKEMSLGQWVFPKAPEAEAAETAVAGPTGAPIAPGYFLSEDDSSVERMVKTCVHMIADAYRYNLEAMARVMETQANAFSKERESMTRAMQAAEKTARIKANSKFRVAAGIPNASDAAVGHDDIEEEETSDGGNNELMKVMFDAVGREIAKKMSGEVPHTTPPPGATTP